LQALPDDGYILINLGHHLIGAGRHHQVCGCASVQCLGVVSGLPRVRVPGHAWPFLPLTQH
jgi:hypothetical protein